MKRKLKLTITKIRRQSIGDRQAMTVRFLCPVCRTVVETLTAAESILFLKIENPTLENLIAGGRIHIVCTASGNLRVCVNSITQNGE